MASNSTDVRPPSLRVPSNRIFALDLIRVVATFMIICFHFNVHLIQMGLAPSTIFGVHPSGSMLGDLGVALFIIISGASLMYRSNDSFVARKFFWRRFLSIYPLFWLSYLCAALFIVTQFPAGPSPFAFGLTIIAMDGFTLYKIPNFYLIGEWYLGCQILLYLLFPFFRKLFLRDRLLAFLLGMMIVVLTVKYYDLGMAINRFPLTHTLEFLFGFSLINLIPSGNEKTLGLLRFLVLGLLWFFFLNSPTQSSVLNMMVLAGIFSLLLSNISCFFETSRLVVIITFLGRYCYGAFLIHHVLILRIFQELKDKHLTQFETYILFVGISLTSFIISLILTRLSHLIVNKISDLWKRDHRMALHA